LVRADDWNLSEPLKTCSLLVEQHGHVLLLIFRFLQKEDDPNSLTVFAKAQIDVTAKDNAQKLSMEYFVESVVDSSRYFVVRIVDDKSGREARIGFGFRDRDEATDFREALNFYQKSIRREEEASEAMKQLEATTTAAAKLSLSEGEKIHINLGGNNKNEKSTIVSSKSSPGKEGNSSSSSNGASPVLLKKPPPAAAPMLLKKPPPAAAAAADAPAKTPTLNKGVSISFGGIDISADHERAAKESNLSTVSAGGLSSEEDALDAIENVANDGVDVDDDEFEDFH